MTFLEFKNLVKQFVAGRELTDGAFASAAADYVQAKSWLERGEARLSGQFMDSFWSSRDDLMGYTFTGTDADLVLAIQGLLAKVDVTDAAATHTLAAKAVSNYVKAQIAREVDSDLELYNSLMAAWERARFDLWGVTYEITGGYDLSTLTTEVDENITIDSTRVGVQDLKTNAINEALALLDASKTWITNLATEARREMSGQSGFIDSLIGAGVRDIQKFIEFYRSGNKTYYSTGGTVPGTEIALHDNKAAYGSMTTGARLKEAWIIVANPVDDVVTTSLQDSILERYPLQIRGWEDRMSMAKGSVPSGNWIALDPRSSQFYTYPAIGGRDMIELIWDTVTADYNDSDDVPFTEDVAEAVAEYLLSKLAMRRPGEGARTAVSISREHMANYVRLRSMLYLDNKDRLDVRDLPKGIVKDCEYACCYTCSDEEQPDTIYTA